MREIAPAALRYQFLEPGPGKRPWVSGGVAGGVGMGAMIAGTIVNGAPLLALLAPVVGAVIGAVVAYSSGPLEPLKNLRATPVSIVPWGIVVDPDPAVRAIPWSRVSAIRYTFVRQQRNEDDLTPRRVIMVFHVGEERIQGTAEEGEWVVSVTELYQRLARAAALPVAGDLAAETVLDTGGLPPALALMRRAAAILDSADGRATLGLESGGYRTTTSRIAGEATREVLRKALHNGSGARDPGPIACILAAELGVRSLLQDILVLILSPSPLLAAVARASAVRLGASLMSAGSVDELRFFLPPADLAELREWMRRGG
jgi:hypothetical protein